MKGNPLNTISYRLMARLSRLQLRYLHRASHYRQVVTAVYLFLASVTALGTIAAMAFLTDLMLLFPPLGPSAFILFNTPLSEAASPRNLILSHSMALGAGLGALALADALFPGTREGVAITMDWHAVFAIAFAMGTTSLVMVFIRCVHPPAAATALIAAMGYLDNLVQIGGVLAAVIFLALEAIFFNRILSGLPYPLWRFNPNVDKLYRTLAGRHPSETSPWQKLTEKTFYRR